jgi:Skp family chaperone for outer membrane proteins
MFKWDRVVPAMAMMALPVFPLIAQDTSEASEPKARPVAVSMFAVVDLAKVFAAHPEAVKAQETLNKERSEMREEFKQKSEALKKALQQHQEEIRAGKKEAAVETLKEVNTLEKQIAALRSTQQRALEERFADEKARVLKLIQKTIAEHNSDGRYALVLDASAASANGLPTVIDASGSDDITEAIVALVKKAKVADEG